MLRDLLVEVGIDVDSSPLKKLNAEIDALTRRLRKVDADPIENLDKQFADVNRSVKKVSRSVSGLDQRLGRLDRTIHSINGDRMADSFADSNEEMERLNRTMRRSERTADRFQDSIEGSRRESRRLNDNLEDADRTSWTMAGTFRRIEKTMKSINKEMSKFSEDVDRAARDFDNLSRSMDRAQSSASGLRREVGGIDLSNASRDSGSLSFNMEGAERSTRNLNRELDRLNNVQGRMGRNRDRNDLIPSFSRRMLGGAIKGFQAIEQGAYTALSMVEKLLAPWKSLTLLMPAMIPVIAGLANVVGNLGPMIGALTGGLLGAVGLFGTAGIGALGGLLPIVGNINAMLELDPKKDKMSAAQVEARQHLDALKDSYGELLKKTEEPVLAGFTKAMRISKRLLKEMEPMFISVSETFDDLMEELGTTLDTPAMKRFFKYINDEAAPMLKSLSKSAGNLVQGLLNLIVSLDPLTKWVATGLENMTQGFADWAKNLGSSNGFQRFVDYTKENLPKLKKIFGGLTMGLINFFAAFGDSSSSMMDGLVDMMGRFREWAADLDNNKNFQNFLSYVKEATPKILNLIGGLADLFVIIAPVLATVGDWALTAANALVDFAKANPDFTKFVIGASIGLLGIGIVLGSIIAPIGAIGAAIGSFGLTLIGVWNLIKGFRTVRTPPLPGGTRRTILGEFGRHTMDTFGGRRAMDHWPNPNDPSNPWSQMDRDFDNRRNGRNTRTAPVPTVVGGSNSLMDVAARQLMAASRGLENAARILSSIRCMCGGAAGGRGGRRSRGRGGNNPVDDLNTRSSRNGRRSTSPVNDINSRTRSNTRGADRAGGLGKMGKVGRVLGPAGLILGGASIVGSIATKDYDNAGRTATSVAGGAGGAWAGAAAGAALGSVVPGIGTAIGGAVGGIVGGLGGSVLGSKLYDGIKEFDWSGLKGTVSTAGKFVGKAWDGIKSGASTAWDGVKSTTSGVWKGVTGLWDSVTGKSNVASAATLDIANSTNATTASATGSMANSWNTIEGQASSTSTGIISMMNRTSTGSQTALGGLLNSAKTIFSGIGSTASNAITAAGSAVISKTGQMAVSAVSRLNSMKSSVAATFNGVVSNASTSWSNFKTVVSTMTSLATTAVMSKVNGLKGTMSTAWSTIRSTAASAWSGVKSAITSPILSAVSVVSGAINRIKNNVSSGISNAVTKAKSAAFSVGKFIMGSHATGLGRVPFDGYIAELHKNEAVLTANQANALRQSGILKGDGVAPQLNMPQSTAEAAGYSPLGVDPGSTATTSTTNNNGSIRASVVIQVDGSKAPQETAVSIKDELEGWFSSLSTVFPATMEG
ncbi:hypothetical protein ABE073_00315 [Lederbergia citrisecunda]|uniref:hypothetical protein n=1 Tax=Lederbergia citrisecunda TaxID=2833583 RepID=UPI003D2C89F6